ncbi:MAG: SoxR reducing system RseC family protein, partial [Bacteroidales bacterium]|nr:SoxR reducing system RseC family protein [Bacteroidales bacterium]
MRHRGVIIKKTEREFQVKLEDPNEVCASCGGCVRLTPARPQEDYVINLDRSQGDFAVGDSVILESGNKNMVRAVAVLYGLPFT